MARIVIKHDSSDDLKQRFKRACVELDSDGTYADNLDLILTFIEEEEGAVDSILEANREMRFR